MADTRTTGRAKMWAKRTPEERAAIMSKVAKAKQSKMTEEEKKEHSQMMHVAKRKKQCATLES